MIENRGLIGGMDERLEVSGVSCSDTLHCCTELTSHQAIAGRYHSPLSLSALSKNPEPQMHRGKCGHRRPTVLQHHMDCDTTGGVVLEGGR